MPERILVETDFLFALRRKDPLHKAAIKLLDEASRGTLKIHVSPSSSIEASLIMKAAGIDEEDVSKALRAMEEAIGIYTSPSFPILTLTHASLAAELRKKYDLTFFDSIHASVALLENLTYVGNDERIRRAVKLEGGRARPL